IEIIRKYSPVPMVLCEGSKIQQVLFNILKNASQAMSLQKTNNPKLILRLLKKEDMVLIEIEDNGPGMDEKTRKKIFEPFFTTKTLNKGTGLGLSVSYFIIVDDHGGEMKVDSAPGRGTTFRIKLPG
ncbi:MAG: GHKL domain-containing protein, partial [archaeon]|nr:GHKL domain-containing protein [archaeon]